jgi:hypothetical protein
MAVAPYLTLRNTATSTDLAQAVEDVVLQLHCDASFADPSLFTILDHSPVTLNDLANNGPQLMFDIDKTSQTRFELGTTKGPSLQSGGAALHPRRKWAAVRAHSGWLLQRRVAAALFLPQQKRPVVAASALTTTHGGA